MVETTIECHSLAETQAFGRQLAAVLREGAVVTLKGPLGAGKTTLVKAVAAGLGCVDDLINSPTFVLIQEYRGRVPVFHVDAYRIKDSDEFLELGGDELLSTSGIVFIEWAERIADILPKDVVSIVIEPTGIESRRLTVRGVAPIPQTSD